DQPLIQARLRLTFGLTLFYLSAFVEAEPLLKKARDAFRDHLGPDHPDTLRAIQQLAATVFASGRRNDALRLYQDVYDRRSQALGSEHADTLRSLNGIARARFEMGDRKEGVDLLERSLSGLTAALGPDDSETLSVASNLAVAYAFTGRPNEALG